MPGKKKLYPVFGQPSSSTTDENREVEAKRRKEEHPLFIWTWNVAGLKACVKSTTIKKGGHKAIANSGADVVLLQETKCNELPPEIMGIDEYPFKKLLASKKPAGYAGVAMLSKQKPDKVVLGIGQEEFDAHGRFIQAEFPDYYLLNIYVPNSGRGLVNLAKRKVWDDLIRKRLTELDKQKPVLFVGDMNVAHNEIDLRNPESNRNKTAGFTDQERADFTKTLEAGPFVDVYRKMNPDKEGAYTYWTYIGGARNKNVGWRLDYFVISERIFDKVKECEIHNKVLGSDHCPLSMKIDI